MNVTEVVLVRTGVANVASVRAAFTRLNVAVRDARDADDVARAEAIVLPGVGAFGAAMHELTTSGLADALRTRVADGRRTLAICLGLQLLCERSEESPEVPGLGVLPVDVVRFAPPVRVPQLGWNAVTADRDARLLDSGTAFFANSFCVRTAPPGWTAARANHGGTFVAALERGAVLACQFHPELSGAFGLSLLSRFVACEGGLRC